MSSRKPLFRNAFNVLGAAAALTCGAAIADALDAPSPVPQAETAGASAEDATITTNVKSRLMGDESLRKSDVTVSSNDGVVTLQGWVSSPDGRQEAEAAARSVDGVRVVHNRLREPSGSDLAIGQVHRIVHIGR